MKLVDERILDYIEEVDSDKPAPGGGSVASLVGTLGIALAKMLGHFSLSKKKFNEASQEDKDRFILSMKELDLFKETLIDGIDNDAISYEAVANAFKNGSDEDKQSALKASAFIAYELQESSTKALEYVYNLIDLGNKNLYSDLICSAILLCSCSEMCGLNVIANANMIHDESIKNKYLEDNKNNINSSKELKEKIIEKINNL